jgi:GTP-binding GTPase N-terminal/GTP-binding GTPase Middle Region
MKNALMLLSSRSGVRIRWRERSYIVVSAAATAAAVVVVVMATAGTYLSANAFVVGPTRSRQLPRTTCIAALVGRNAIPSDHQERQKPLPATSLSTATARRNSLLGEDVQDGNMNAFGSNMFDDLEDEDDFNLPDLRDTMKFEYDDDDEQDSEGLAPFLAGTERDEANVLEEREDRLYVDQDGIKRKVETCILVGVENLTAKRNNQQSSNNFFTLDESMTEMRELIKTAGLELVGEVTQRLNQVNPKTYIGTGKVIEAKDLLNQYDSCTVVFDAELTPGQQKALENALNKNLIQNDFLVSDREIKVVDRTALILDIFAQHAKTREGRLQVDLALHEYRKPRLTRMWTHLERQSGAGGVGLRGPGESQLEIDKRLLRDRIIVLRQKIDDVQKQRDIHRRGRERMGLPILSLVGYTNAGKVRCLDSILRREQTTMWTPR